MYKTFAGLVKMIGILQIKDNWVLNRRFQWHSFITPIVSGTNIIVTPSHLNFKLSVGMEVYITL